MGLKSLVQFFIDNEDEINEFALWAFGKTYKEEVGLIRYMKLWNERHSDIFELNESGNAREDMKEMIRLCRMNINLKPDLH